MKVIFEQLLHSTTCPTGYINKFIGSPSGDSFLLSMSSDESGSDCHYNFFSTNLREQKTFCLKAKGLVYSSCGNFIMYEKDENFWQYDIKTQQQKPVFPGLSGKLKFQVAEDEILLEKWILTEGNEGGEFYNLFNNKLTFKIKDFGFDIDSQCYQLFKKKISPGKDFLAILYRKVSYKIDKEREPDNEEDINSEDTNLKIVILNFNAQDFFVIDSTHQYVKDYCFSPCNQFIAILCCSMYYKLKPGRYEEMEFKERYERCFKENYFSEINENFRIEIWDLQSKKLIKKIKDESFNEHLKKMRYSPCGKFLIVKSNTDPIIIKIIDIYSGGTLQTLEFENNIKYVFFTHNFDRLMAFKIQDERLDIYSYDTSLMKEYEGMALFLNTHFPLNNGVSSVKVADGPGLLDYHQFLAQKTNVFTGYNSAKIKNKLIVNKNWFNDSIIELLFSYGYEIYMVNLFSNQLKRLYNKQDYSRENGVVELDEHKIALALASQGKTLEDFYIVDFFSPISLSRRPKKMIFFEDVKREELDDSNGSFTLLNEACTGTTFNGAAFGDRLVQGSLMVSMTMKNGRKIKPEMYRLNITIAKMNYENEKSSLATFIHAEYQPYESPKNIESEFDYVASFNLMGVISEKVKIPVLSFYDCIVFSTVLPREIKCLYSKAANEYCLTSTEKININISYNIYRIKNAIQISRGSTEQQFLDRFKKDESEFESKRRKFLDKKELDTLNEKYSKFYWFKEKLKGIDIFDELFDIKKIFSAEEICEKLSHYFRSYSSEQFKEMPDFILAIRNRIGACRHRAISFHVLLQSWDIRSHVVSNDRHAWAEVLLYNVKKKQSEWVTYELGGTHATFTLDRECINAILSQKTLPFENRVGSLTSKIQKLNQPKVDFIKPPSSQVDKHSRTVLKNHIEPNSFSQVHKYPRTAPKNDMERNSLFRIEDDDVISFLRVIRKNYSSTYKNIFYIHCPEDFKSLWNVFSIEKNGSTKSQEGPLRILIDEKGLLIVNWSKFDETQKASYMSLLDNPRKINSFSLYSDIETINFIDKNPQELSRSFLSRCTLKTLPKDFLKKEVEPKNSDDSLKRNFYSLPNWKDFLWGKINIEKKRFSFKEGLAFAAIRQKKSLVILNPPEKDEEFDSFIHNFNGLKKVLLNGALMEVPEECIISLEKNSQDEVGVEIIMIEENYKSYSNVYYLNMATYWNFFERMRVTSEGMPEILPGWLNNYDFKKDVIIMTQALPTNYVNYFKKIANDLGLKSLNVSVLNDARTEDGSQEKKFYNVQIYIRLTTLNMS